MGASAPADAVGDGLDGLRADGRWLGYAHIVPEVVSAGSER